MAEEDATHLAVDGLVVGVDELERVRSVPVHKPVADGRAAVGEQEGHLVGGLLAEGDEVPEHVGVLRKKKLGSML